ncbi:MAG: T9SS type A sorting domain-containing protein [Roseivirga sp.]|nr:T9SS type A sorting domain-containing protein [Roseivirga sp.]
MSESVFNPEVGIGVLVLDAFALALTGGTSHPPEGPCVSPTAGEGLAGGETTVRVNFSTTGTADGSETLQVDLVATAVYDVAGNAADADQTSNNTVPLNDKTPPTITGITTNTDNRLIVVTFSEGVYGSDAGSGGLGKADFNMFLSSTGAVNAINIDNIYGIDFDALIGGETEVTINFTPVEWDQDGLNILSILPDGSEIFEVDLVASSIFDAAGNAASADQTANNTGALVDQVAPTVTSFIIDDTALLPGETATLTLVFDEAITGLTSGDLTVPNGGITEPASEDGGITFTATYTPNAEIEDATNEIVLDLTGIQDIAGNAGEGTAKTANFTLDSRTPALNFATTSSSGAESVSSVDLEVGLALVSGVDVTVDYTVTGTATGSGTDYTLADGTLTFLAGTTSKNITIASIIDDAIVETDETVIVTLSNPTNAALITNSIVHTYTITDNDAATLSIGDVTQTEGNSGTSIINIPVTLTGEVQDGFSVEADAILSGDAAEIDANDVVASGDPTITSAVLRFTGNNGEIQNLQVTLNGDEVVENDETFAVLIGNVQASGKNVTVSDFDATITVTNDDAATLSIDDVTLNEGSDGENPEAVFTVTLTGAVEAGISVDAAASDGTADNSDYISPGTETLNFTGTDGETKTYKPTINGDDLDEANESFSVLLNNLNASGLNVTISDDTGAGTITNDDATPAFTSGTTASSQENATATGYTAAATDADNGALTFSLGTNKDEAFFSIDENTGVLSFQTAPDFENPGDADTNNDYEVEVKVTDGANEVTQTVSVTVTNEDEAPVFTSGSTEAFEENETGTVYTATATDADSQTITYRLANSSDEDVTSLFELNASSGVLTFKEAQNYETAAGNANEGKQFTIDIIASDEANNETTRSLTISLIDVNEIPVVSSNPVTEVNDNEKYEYFGFITDPDDRTSFNAFNAVEALDLPSWLNLKSKTSSVSLLELKDDGESIDADFLSDASHLVRDSQGNVIVNLSDDFVNELFKVSPDGVLSLLELKDAAGDEFESGVITAMTLDKNDILYFTSLGTSSVELFQMDMNGTVTAVRTDPDDASINALSFLPLDMTFDHEQSSLYFLEEDGRVHYLNLSDFEIESIPSSGEDNEFDKALIGINNQNQIYTYLSTRDALLIRYTQDEEGFVKETILDSEDDLVRETAQILEDVEDLLFSSDDKFLFIASDQIYEFNESVFEFEPFNDAEAGVERDNPFEFEDIKLFTEANGIINYIYINGLGEMIPGEEIFAETTDPLAVSAFEKVLTGKFFSRTTDLEDENPVTGMASNRLGHMLLILDDGLDLNLIKDDKVFDARFELVDKEDPDNSDILRGEIEWEVLGVTATGDFLLTADGSLLISISPDDLDDLFEITEIPDRPGADIQLPYSLLYVHEGSQTTIWDARLDSDGNVLVILNESGGEGAMSRLVKLNPATDQETDLIDENSQIEGLDEFFLAQMEIDADDNIYLTDIENEIILKLDQSGNLSILTDLPGVFGLTISGNNQLYASTPVRLYSISSDGTATALAGRDESGTPIDGTGEEARFREISSIFIDESVGLIYILDDESVRVATLKSADFILSGEAAGQVGTHNVNLQISDLLDTELSLLHDFTITVLDVTAPAITSNSQAGFDENGTDDILSFTAEDSNPNAVLSFILSGADAALFAIDPNDQGLSFIAAPDFENPEDDGADNVYSITLEVKDDAENSTTQELTITVNDLNDEAPEFTSSNTIGIDENTTAVVSLTATDADANSNLTFSITGGADQSLFNLNGADLSLLVAEDFEQPTQQDQSYEVEVTVSDGTNSDVQAITVTITDTDDNAPIITSDGGTITAALTIAENGTAVTTITATDADALSTVSFSITGGADQALFSMTNGTLSFSTAPDFETPADNDSNNAYEVEVTATDGTNADIQTITVTITDVDEIAPDAPVITGISDDTGSSATDGVTSNRNILVYGTAEAEANVDVFSPGGKIGTVQANANGDWTLDISQFNLPQFTADMTAEAVDLAGNRSAASAPFTLTIDFTAPDAPAITGISDDTGSSATDGITSDHNLLIHGTAEAGASVDVFSSAGKIGTVEADSNGDWTLDISQFNLPEFTADMTAEAIDLAGNRSVTSDPFSLTIDFTAPAKPAITHISDDTGSSASDGITNDRNIIVHGTAEAGASVDVFSPGGKVGTVEADTKGDWVLDLSQFNLPQFTADMTAQAFDLAGNRSLTSDPFTLTIDFTAPDAPAITHISDDTGNSANDGVTSDRNILVYGTAEAGASVDVFSPGGKIGTVEADSKGDWVLDISQFNLPEFTADMTAEAVDLAGNRSAASAPFTLTIDFTAPAKPAITHISDDTGSSATDGVTSDRNILVHGTAESGTSVDVFSPGGKIGTVEADTNGDWVLDISRFNLPQFTADMTAEAVDLAGNRSETSDPFTLTIDFTGPGVTIDLAGSSGAGQQVNAVFDEEVSGLTLAEITVTGGTASDLVQTSATTYSFVVSSSGGAVDVSISANTAEDLAGNGNTASNQLTLNFTDVSTREDFTNLQNVSKAEEINVYPNPASDVLTIDLSELSAEAVDIQMYNASGTPVFTKKAYRQQMLKLDVSDYTSGIYIVQCYDGQQVIRKKVMVKK